MTDVTVRPRKNCLPNTDRALLVVRTSQTGQAKKFLDLHVAYNFPWNPPGWIPSLDTRSQCAYRESALGCSEEGWL